MEDLKMEEGAFSYLFSGGITSAIIVVMEALMAPEPPPKSWKRGPARIE